jgi:hypothetical protein
MGYRIIKENEIFAAAYKFSELEVLCFADFAGNRI